MQDIQPMLIDNGPILEATGLVHRVIEPSRAGPHPTIVMLHGRSGNEEVMWIFEKTISVNWLKIAPRAIETDPFGGFSWALHAQDSWPTVSMFDRAVTAVAKFIHALPSIYNADPDHIYLMGFSQGAACVYAIAIQHPGLIQAIAGLVGFLPEGSDTHKAQLALDSLPVFMAVGTQDKHIPHARAQSSAATLRNAHADLSYNEYEVGHKLSRQGAQDLTQWWAKRGR